ncbi:hypothetical protein [Sphingorhabdus sp.]|uniref:hypothetical protein n=1 Tax=Sphingorhabdus sp. TaxID=1902408 RepID=UPI00398364B2
MLKSIAIMSALFLAPVVMAQDAPPPPPPPPAGGMPQPEQIFAFLDADKDGFIAKDEAQGPMVQYFANIDADKDEKISLVELKTAMDAMRPPEPAQAESE